MFNIFHPNLQRKIVNQCLSVNIITWNEYLFQFACDLYNKSPKSRFFNINEIHTIFIFEGITEKVLEKNSSRRIVDISKNVKTKKKLMRAFSLNIFHGAKI